MADEQRLKAEQVAWLKDGAGKWFWQHLAQWCREYQGDASRPMPLKKENFEVFDHSKKIACGRAVMCEDILAFVQDVADSYKPE